MEGETEVVFETESNSKISVDQSHHGVSPVASSQSWGDRCEGEENAPALDGRSTPARTKGLLNLRASPRKMISRPISMVPSHDNL